MSRFVYSSNNNKNNNHICSHIACDNLFCECATAAQTTGDVDIFDEDEINQVLGLHDDSPFNDLNQYRSFIQANPPQDKIFSSGFSFPPPDLAQLDMPQSYFPSQPSTPLPTLADLSQSLKHPLASHCSAAPKRAVMTQEVAEVNKPEKVPEKPKRFLTAYNFFFKDERARLLKILPVKHKTSRKAHGKIGFAEMARTVAANWKKISPEQKMEYEYRSELDKERFAVEHAAWKNAKQLLQPTGCTK